jgi:hypothetical protein
MFKSVIAQNIKWDQVTLQNGVPFLPVLSIWLGNQQDGDDRGEYII